MIQMTTASKQDWDKQQLKTQQCVRSHASFLNNNDSDSMCADTCPPLTSETYSEPNRLAGVYAAARRQCISTIFAAQNNFLAEPPESFSSDENSNLPRNQMSSFQKYTLWCKTTTKKSKLNKIHAISTAVILKFFFFFTGRCPDCTESVNYSVQQYSKSHLFQYTGQTSCNNRFRFKNENS